MPRKIYNAKKFQSVYNDHIQYPSLSLVALAFGVNERTIRDWVVNAKEEGIQLIDRSSLDAATDLRYGRRIGELNARIHKLQDELREANTQSTSSDKLLAMFHEAKGHEFNHVPDWLNYNKKSTSITGIPTLFLSDIHFDEVVEPAQVEYLNDYNREIAVKRIQYTFNTTLELLLKRMASPKYEGIVVALGGDMLSGNIHEELAETNENYIFQSLVDLAELLIQGIGTLADEFGKVFVPCVVGNHGRIHRKPRAKGKVMDNYEWLIYHMIAKAFKSDGRITMHIPESSDIQYNIYQKRFLLTHGDQFRGGAGISGIFTPLMLGRARKQQRQAVVNKSFDTMLCGHFHQLILTDHLIVNGSIKGIDEYAYLANFGFERPQQALFIVHPAHGLTLRMPIICDGYENGQKKGAAIISVR